MRKVLFIPDCHRPFHHRAAWRTMITAAKGWKPDVIVVLGDFGDFYSVSRHSKSPKVHVRLHDEVVSVQDGLDELAELGASKMVYVEGNHEDRLDRYLCDKAPELYDVTSFHELVDLNKRGWDYIPYRSHGKLGKLYLCHDVGYSGLNALRQTMATFGGSVVMGHTHRLEYRVHNDISGHAHVGASFGWLGDPRNIDYISDAKKAQWYHGFGIGYQCTKTGRIHIQPVPIIRGACIIEGKVYRGR